jgi:hypothetical protein
MSREPLSRKLIRRVGNKTQSKQKKQPTHADRTITTLQEHRLRYVRSDKIGSYAELWEFIRVSLRIQNPEWVAPNGDSPLCDSYEARFAELLGLTHPREDDAAYT